MGLSKSGSYYAPAAWTVQCAAALTYPIILGVTLKLDFFNKFMEKAKCDNIAGICIHFCLKLIYDKIFR